MQGLKQQTSAPPESNDPPGRLALEMAAVVLEAQTFEQAATALASRLALAKGCSRVAVGVRRRGGCRLVALSHAIGAEDRSETGTQMGALMDEALDPLQTVAWPEPEALPPAISQQHHAYARQQGLSQVCTLPLLDRGRPFGALTLEWETPPAVDFAGLQHLATLVGPLLAARYEAERPWHALRQRLARWFSVRPALAAAAVAVLLILAVYGLVTIPGDYRVSAGVLLEPEQQRTVVAPLHGFVASARYRAGDRVAEGEELASLDRRELELERDKLRGELQQIQREYRRALAGHDRARTAIFKARAEQTRARLALLAEQIARTHLVAPVTGYVVSGDLSQAIGAPVDRGETLFRVAPLDSYRVVLQVDEWDIGAVQVGQRGALVLNALPETELSVRVARLTPVSSIEEGRNRFRVEADLLSPPDGLRPGMTGVARLDAGQRSLAWLLTHRVVDWGRRQLWALGW